MQTGIVRTADDLLLPGVGPLAMFKILEAALSPFKRSPIVVRTTHTLSVPFFHLDLFWGYSLLIESAGKTPPTCDEIVDLRHSACGHNNNKNGLQRPYSRTCILTQIYDLVACVRLAYPGRCIRK